jgi:hypothetical protein
MPNKAAIKVIVFKVLGVLAVLWAVYWLHGTYHDMVDWFGQGEYSNVIFTVLIGLCPVIGWVYAVVAPRAPD